MKTKSSQVDDENTLIFVAPISRPKVIATIAALPWLLVASFGTLSLQRSLSAETPFPLAFVGYLLAGTPILLMVFFGYLLVQTLRLPKRTVVDSKLQMVYLPATPFRSHHSVPFEQVAGIHVLIGQDGGFQAVWLCLVDATANKHIVLASTTRWAATRAELRQFFEADAKRLGHWIACPVNLFTSAHPDTPPDALHQHRGSVDGLRWFPNDGPLDLKDDPGESQRDI